MRLAAERAHCPGWRWIREGRGRGEKVNFTKQKSPKSTQLAKHLGNTRGSKQHRNKDRMMWCAASNYHLGQTTDVLESTKQKGKVNGTGYFAKYGQCLGWQVGGNRKYGARIGEESHFTSPPPPDTFWVLLSMRLAIRSEARLSDCITSAVGWSESWANAQPRR